MSGGEEKMWSRCIALEKNLFSIKKTHHLDQLFRSE